MHMQIGHQLAVGNCGNIPAKHKKYDFGPIYTLFQENVPLQTNSKGVIGLHFGTVKINYYHDYHAMG